MSHPLFWPSSSSFRPIGDSPAVSLTQDLSPEQSADILLLGCGDPRNILFTLYADVVATSSPRKLDITCCDTEPATLARNILLFTLLEENETIHQVWNIFYHFKVDDQTLDILMRQSERLAEYGQDIETWRQSLYGSFIKLVDSRTLDELRCHWKNYAGFSSLPPSRLDKLRKQQSQVSATALKTCDSDVVPDHSSAWTFAPTSVISLSKRYWETGTTFTLDQDIENAKNINPTFVYSSSGEGFSIHPDTSLRGFHLAPDFVAFPPGFTGTEATVADAMNRQFKGWGEAFR